MKIEVGGVVILTNPSTVFPESIARSLEGALGVVKKILCDNTYIVRHPCDAWYNLEFLQIISPTLGSFFVEEGLEKIGKF